MDTKSDQDESKLEEKLLRDQVCSTSYYDSFTLERKTSAFNLEILISNNAVSELTL